MTKEEIMNMKDKNKLNTTIAKMIYKYYDVYQDDYDGEWYFKTPYCETILVPNYCEDMFYALQLIERFDYYSLNKRSGYANVQYDVIVEPCMIDGTYSVVRVVSESLPEAICKASLIASLI